MNQMKTCKELLDLLHTDAKALMQIESQYPDISLLGLKRIVSAKPLTDEENCLLDRYNKHKDSFYNTFDTLFIQSADESYYWDYCPFDVYKRTLPERVESKRQNLAGISIGTMYREEIENISQCIQDVPKESISKDRNIKSLKLMSILIPMWKTDQGIHMFGYGLFRDSDTIFNRYYFNQQEKIDYLNKLIENESNNLILPTVSTNVTPHPRIFKDIDAFELFEICKEKANDIIDNLAFFYGKMKEENKILVGNSEFQEWLNRTYEISAGKIKPLSQLCNIDKKNALYSMCKEVQISRKNSKKTK